jgi:prepilin-type N-terminal cleavage/methylation domain-containing protein
MRKFSGFTFLELIVVVALIGILASFTMMSSKDTSKTYSLLAEAESVASKISLVVAEAQSSQSSIRLICDGQVIYAQYFRGQKSNALYASGAVGKSVATATSSTPSKTIIILDYAFKTPQNKTLMFNCNNACSGGNTYITSDGSLLNTNTCASGNSFELVLYSTQNTNISSKVTFSAVGYPRIYLQDSSIISIPREIIN